MKMTHVSATILILAVFVAPAIAAPCESLMTLSVPNTTVTLAQTVAPGAFTQPGARGGGNNAYASLPAFCRIAITLKPTPRSDIKSELWMPAAGWNGRFLVVGNGGFAGTIGYGSMATSLAAGYAVASTDTGHTGPATNTFVNDDVFVDYVHRAIHETTVAGKKFVDSFYDDPLRFTYFSGCSTGGRQALQAVQRYPEDFNGIIAGDTGVVSSRQAFGQNWMHHVQVQPGSALSKENLQLLNEAVLNACDALDGARDGVLEVPRSCKFDPQVLICKPGQGTSCLTAPQVEAVRKLYAGPTNPRTGEQIFSGLEKGSEVAWLPGPTGLAADYFRYLVFKDPKWDPKTLDFDKDFAHVQSREDLRVMDSGNPDLSSFTKRGGRLIMYHGWADTGIPPGWYVKYYGDVQAKTAGAKDATRLFMVPGMGHCGGGNGASTFDMVSALDKWLTSGKAPETVPASRVRDGKVERTRPLCAYPKAAFYKGSGNMDDAANFECRVGSGSSN